MSKKPKNRESEKKGLSIKEREENPTSVLDKPLIFSLRHVQKNHCLTKCTKEEKARFADAIFKRKDKKWVELCGTQHGGLGCEEIRNGLNVTIPDFVRGEGLYSFRFSGEKAMVGFRKENIFYILWFDRSFDVYRH